MKSKADSILLGIDIGTTGAKCTFYDLTGSPVYSEYQEYPMIHPQPGWVEEDPNEWWKAAANNILKSVRGGHIDPADVAGIGVSCTNSIIPLDQDGNNLYNAILQLDQRAAEEVEWIRKALGEERIFRVTGNQVARGTYSLPTLRWFLKHRPDIMEHTYKFVVPSGFIIQKLTGQFTINVSRMGFTLLSNIRTGTWDEDLIRDAGLDPWKFPRSYEACEIVGGVTPEAAVLTGLKEGTPVVAGAMDTVAAAVGAGAIHDGDMFLAVGTCGRLCYSTETPSFDSRLMNCRNVLTNTWLNVEATNGAGVSLRWFRDVFGGALEKEAQRQNISIYQAMDQLAEKSSPGANGVLYLPYLAGERCPIWDPDAKGVFFGVSLETGYGDLVRAVMEGVAFSIKQGMEIVLKDKSRKQTMLPLGGGIAKSTIWSRIFCDVLGCTIIRMNINETETLGDAILAAYGVGLTDDLYAMSQYALKSSEMIEPDPEAYGTYKKYFQLYQSLYEHIRGDFKTLTGLIAES